ESRTRQRLAALYEASGAADAAMLERAEAGKYAAMEARALPRFDRVYVCSEHDRAAVARAHPGARVAVVPNGVRLPRSTPKPPAAPFTFLFVGSLGYFPNEDAALFFGSAVLPRLRVLAPAAFRVHIAGSGPSARLRALSAEPEVWVTGPVTDIAAAYAGAHAVVIPLRAGGGTRIKLLEAFAYRRPAVSTAIGAEGLAIRNGAHTLVADTPDAFAKQCARLMEDAALREHLVARAFDLVRTAHT